MAASTKRQTAKRNQARGRGASCCSMARGGGGEVYSIAIQFGNSIRFSCLIEFKTKRMRRVTNKHTHTARSLSLGPPLSVCVSHFVATVGGVTRPRVRVIFSNFSTYAATAVLPSPCSHTASLSLLLPRPLPLLLLLRCVARIFSRFIY